MILKTWARLHNTHTQKQRFKKKIKKKTPMKIRSYRKTKTTTKKDEKTHTQ
jgi:hypothetical protein